MMLPRANLFAGIRIVAEVTGPALARGLIIRRRGVMRIADWPGLDHRAIQCLERCNLQYGRGPILVRTGARYIAFILNPDDVHRVLRETPYPFASASLEKRAALVHFEPKNVLISEGAERAERRGWNERVLESECPRHRFTGNFLHIISGEVDVLQAKIAGREELV